MKTVSVYDSVGMVLAHDLTQIIPGKHKGSRFKKGYTVTEVDIPILLDMGKKNLYVLELGDGMVHEDDAAIRIARSAAGKGVCLSEPREGKVEISAAFDGLLKVDIDRLTQVNDQDEVMFSTLHTNQLVQKGQVLAGTRVIPLVVEDKVVHLAEKACTGGILIDVRPITSTRVGIITTGSEVFSGRIKDGFGPVLRKKFASFGCEVIRQILVSDEEERIVSAIHELLSEGAGIIAVTGGMSVDPDDRTPASIRKAGADIVTYGAPVLPGAMFLLAYIGDVPVIGLPGCVMYHKISIFDLILPRLLAGERPTRAEIKALAHGGLCRNCKECHFPNCSFGKA